MRPSGAVSRVAGLAGSARAVRRAGRFREGPTRAVRVRVGPHGTARRSVLEVVVGSSRTPSASLVVV
ncbi:hypothetical protein BIU90_13345 [Curtobacterium sp. MCBA15_001]|nr:hypothetical protein BIU90_13345 [Curtobacterium sp. MCBA15_001]